MSLLTIEHLPLLVAKFDELKSIHDTLTHGAPSHVGSEIFKRHYTDGCLNELAYRNELDAVDAMHRDMWELSYKNIEDLRTSIVECKKHISINNALNLIS
jgi:hypothetical protein